MRIPKYLEYIFQKTKYIICQILHSGTTSDITLRCKFVYWSISLRNKLFEKKIL